MTGQFGTNWLIFLGDLHGIDTLESASQGHGGGGPCASHPDGAPPRNPLWRRICGLFGTWLMAVEALGAVAPMASGCF